jgi:peptide/nickel transport system ATP-binding protein
MIALALACEPSLLIADEPTTALDVTIQAQIIELLLRQVSARGTALLLISHNIGVVRECCSRIIAMYAGQVVEDSPSDALLERPLHPYASGLLRSHPRFAAHRARLPSIGGRAPTPTDMPAGCRFAPRCPHRLADCETPQPFAAVEGRLVRCHRAATLHLAGAVP